MPIYGYTCASCEHAFDALQKMSDARLTDCPECGEASLQKQLSAPKFRLKGAGWYETDFKTGDKRNIAGDADKKSDGKSKDSDSETAKKDTKKPEVKIPDSKKPDSKKPDSKKSDSGKSSSNNKAKSA